MNKRFFLLLMGILVLIYYPVYAAEGDVLWTSTWNNPNYNADDEARGITLDNTGNLYIVGVSSQGVNQEDLLIQKYDNYGNEVWTSTINVNGYDGGLTAISYDKAGYIYAGGGADGEMFWLSQLDTDGLIKWTTKWNEVDSWSWGNDIDSGGNIVASSLGGILVKYDSNGNLKWRISSSSTALILDVSIDENYIYACGAIDPSYNIWIGKFNLADGSEIWWKDINASANIDQGINISYDSEGIYVCGSVNSTGIKGELWLSKHNKNDGGIIWSKRWGTSGTAWAISLSDSHIYLTGSDNLSGNDDIVIYKFDKKGDEIFQITYDGGGDDIGYGIFVDESENFYVCGSQDKTGEGKNVWIRKYQGPEPIETEVNTGEIKIQGGERGYVNPDKGEIAKIHFKANNTGKVKVEIYTLRGQLVWKDSKETDGNEDYIQWACKNSEERVVASGVYIIYVKGPGIKTTKKITILR